MNDIADRVTRILIESLGVDGTKITPHMSFSDDLGVDSLDAIELVMAFETEFGCTIPDEAVRRIVTVKDAVGFIAAESPEARSAGAPGERVPVVIPAARRFAPDGFRPIGPQQVP